MDSLFSITSPVTSPFTLESVSSKKLEETKNKTEKTQFKEILQNAINDVNETHIIANEQIEGLIRGDEGISMHNVMLAMQEAQLSTQLLIEVRNKVFDCYKEVTSVTL